jgi:hypothetical protein
MKRLSSAVGTAVGFMMVLSFGIAILALVYNLAASQVPGLHGATHNTIQALRCMVGVPAPDSPCFAAEVEALEAEREVVEAALSVAEGTLAEAEAELAQIAAREAELRSLSASVESFNLFESVERPYGTVTTGVRFPSILEPERWERAWCYVSRDVDGPVDPRIDVGIQNFGEAIQWAQARDPHLAEVGISRAQFEDARENCAFPDAM